MTCCNVFLFLQHLLRCSTLCECTCLWVCASLQRARRLPVKHCFPLPLQSWRWPSLRCTSWLWLWCRLLQTLPKTPTQCSLRGCKVIGQFALMRKEEFLLFCFSALDATRKFVSASRHWSVITTLQDWLGINLVEAGTRLKATGSQQSVCTGSSTNHF